MNWSKIDDIEMPIIDTTEIRNSIRQSNRVIDSNYQYYEFVCILDAASLAE